MNNLRWQLFKPSTLPEVLFGEAPIENFGSSYINRVALEENVFAVGFPENNKSSSYNPPALLVISNCFVPDALSWLKVYAPQTSPLSQLARVISIEDWDTFQDAGRQKNSSQQRSDCWGSIVLGEALSQGDADVDLSTMPLSRSQACFSTAVARAAIVHGIGDATSLCIERLKKLASDKRFVRRSVSADDLLPIWKIMFAQLENNSFDVLSEAILISAKKYSFGATTSNQTIPTLDQYPLLQSNSIEDRTVEYKRLASEIMLNFAERTYSAYSSALLAVAAFLVGRGTSHGFLLRPIAKRLPSVFAWFGLIAALVGPKSWDTDWSRATKGIERLLRNKFDWCEPSLSDLCWEEYVWIARTFEGYEAFGSLPKMQPRVLSVEVIPGAMCQLRLSSGIEANNNDVDMARASQQDHQSAALQATLLQLANIAQEALALINTPKAPHQQTLGLYSTEEPQAVVARPKRGKRNNS